MPKYVIHENGWFFEWSTIVDAPVSQAMRRADMLAYLEKRYGTEWEQAARLDRAEVNGASALCDFTKDDIVAYNRAGPKEGRVAWKTILRQVGIPERDRSSLTPEQPSERTSL